MSSHLKIHLTLSTMANNSSSREDITKMDQLKLLAEVEEEVHPETLVIELVIRVDRELLEVAEASIRAQVEVV